jgi:hypothetical protein
MLFSSWLRTLRTPWARTGRQNRRPVSQRRGRRPTVEQLEDRVVPSATWIEQGPGVITGGLSELPAQNNATTGAVEALAVDPTNANIAYAGSVNGGVWRTDNLTAVNPRWRPLTDQELPFLDINSLAISPVNHNEIFAGTGPTSAFGNLFGAPGFGVGRSLDGGKHWQVLGADVLAGQTIRSIVPTSLNDGQVVLAASFLAGNGFVAPSTTEGGGAYRSADGGVTWTQLSGAAGTGLPAESVSDLVADPGNPNRFYAAVDVLGPFATGKEGVYRSDDGGLSWIQVNNGLTGLDTSARILLAVHNSPSGNAVYAMVMAQEPQFQSGGLEGVFRSTDHGADWTSMGTPPVDIFQAGQGAIWHGAIVADQHDPNVVYISGDGDFTRPGLLEAATIFRGDVSQAPGNVWTSAYSDGANNTAPHADSRAMVFESNGNLLEASDGGIARLDHPNDASVRQWRFISLGLADVEFHNVAYDPLSKVIIGGAQDNGTPIQAKPGKGLWDDSLAVPGDGGVVQVDSNQTAHPGTSIRYASAEFLQGFNRSTWDANNNFLGSSLIGLNIVVGPTAGRNLGTDPLLPTGFVTPIAVNSVDPMRLLIGTTTLYESFDRGDTLADLNFSNGQFVGGSLSSIAFFSSSYGQPMVYGGRLDGVGNPDVIWAGVGNQIVYREHLGDPLQVVSGYHGDFVETIVADPQNYRHIFAVDLSNQVWASFDAGQTFRNVTANLSQLTPIVATINVIRTGPSAADLHLVAGAANGVFALGPPAGEQQGWYRLGDNLPHALVMDLRYSAQDNLLLAGTLGRGAWTLPNPFGADDSKGGQQAYQSPGSGLSGASVSTLPREPRILNALFAAMAQEEQGLAGVDARLAFSGDTTGGGSGGNGGDGLGGGVYVASGAACIDHTSIIGNQAVGGAAGKHGSAGQGIGGGLYVAAFATADGMDTNITGNFATISNDDVFGVFNTSC